LQVNGTLAFDHCLLRQTDVSVQIDIWDVYRIRQILDSQKG